MVKLNEIFHKHIYKHLLSFVFFSIIALYAVNEPDGITITSPGDTVLGLYLSEVFKNYLLGDFSNYVFFPTNNQLAYGETSFLYGITLSFFLHLFQNFSIAIYFTQVLALGISAFSMYLYFYKCGLNSLKSFLISGPFIFDCFFSTNGENINLYFVFPMFFQLILRERSKHRTINKLEIFGLFMLNLIDILNSIYLFTCTQIFTLILYTKNYLSRKSLLILISVFSIFFCIHFSALVNSVDQAHSKVPEFIGKFGVSFLDLIFGNKNRQSSFFGTIFLVSTGVEFFILLTLVSWGGKGLARLRILLITLIGLFMVLIPYYHPVLFVNFFPYIRFPIRFILILRLVIYFCTFYLVLNIRYKKPVIILFFLLFFSNIYQTHESLKYHWLINESYFVEFKHEEIDKDGTYLFLPIWNFNSVHISPNAINGVFTDYYRMFFCTRIGINCINGTNGYTPKESYLNYKNILNSKSETELIQHFKQMNFKYLIIDDLSFVDVSKSQKSLIKKLLKSKKTLRNGFHILDKKILNHI